MNILNKLRTELHLWLGMNVVVFAVVGRGLGRRRTFEGAGEYGGGVVYSALNESDKENVE